MKVVNSKEGFIMSLFMIKLGCAHNDEATRQMVPHKNVPLGQKEATPGTRSSEKRDGVTFTLFLKTPLEYILSWRKKRDTLGLICYIDYDIFKN